MSILTEIKHYVFKCCYYFFLTALKALLRHLLQWTLPWIIFTLGALNLVLQTLQTKTFLNFLASASGNLTIKNTPSVFLVKLKNLWLFENEVFKSTKIFDFLCFLFDHYSAPFTSFNPTDLFIFHLLHYLVIHFLTEKMSKRGVQVGFHFVQSHGPIHFSPASLPCHLK